MNKERLTPTTETIIEPVPCDDAVWAEFMRDIEVPKPAPSDTAWQAAVEHIETRDPARVLAGQRFQGQGQ